MYIYILVHNFLSILDMYIYIYISIITVFTECTAIGTSSKFDAEPEPCGPKKNAAGCLRVLRFGACRGDTMENQDRNGGTPPSTTIITNMCCLDMSWYTWDGPFIAAGIEIVIAPATFSTGLKLEIVAEPGGLSQAVMKCQLLLKAPQVWDKWWFDDKNMIYLDKLNNGSSQTWKVWLWHSYPNLVTIMPVTCTSQRGQYHLWSQDQIWVVLSLPILDPRSQNHSWSSSLLQQIQVRFLVKRKAIGSGLTVAKLGIKTLISVQNACSFTITGKCESSLPSSTETNSRTHMRNRSHSITYIYIHTAISGKLSC